MCRWFAYISPDEHCLLQDVLIDPQNALSKQVSSHFLPKLMPHHDEHKLQDSDDKLLTMRNSLLNMDGMGVAFYTPVAAEYFKGTTGTRPLLYKSISPPINDFNFRSLCANTQTKCVIAHIRASSGSAVVQTNCHPFVFGRHSFMHNGVVASFNDIRRPLCDMMAPDAFANIAGTADSEHLAAMYMTNLTKGGKKDAWEAEYSVTAMLDAMVQAVLTVLKLQYKHCGGKATPNSLNLCATDGQKLVAIRFRNHASEQPPSLYYSTTAGQTLNKKYPGHADSVHGAAAHNPHATRGAEEHGKHVIVASEPTTFAENEWSLIPRNSAIIVDGKGGVDIQPIPYDAQLNAVDPNFPG